MKISIVTAYRTQTGIIKELLAHLNNYVEGNIIVEVIVTNNNQEEEIRPVGNTRYTYKYLKSDKPLSYCEVMNKGIREAEGDYVVVMGNDMFPTSRTWLEELVDVYERTDAHIVSPVNFKDKRPWYNSKSYANNNPIIYKGISISSGCWMMRRDRLILFDEAYRHGFHCEDDDVCQQVKKLGGKLVLAPGVIMNHRHDEGEYANSDDLKKLREVNVNVFRKKWPNII